MWLNVKFPCNFAEMLILHYTNLYKYLQLYDNNHTFLAHNTPHTFYFPSIQYATHSLPS